MKVLLVDDSRAVRDRIALLLRECGEIHEVLEAADVDAALALIARSPPDVLVIDIHLPGPSGLDLLRTLRATSATAPRVIMLTNAASEQHRRECMALGADVFLDKSTDADRLLHAVLSHRPSPSVPRS